MWKRLLVVSAVSAAMSSMALAAPLTVGFSQVGIGIWLARRRNQCGEK